jgi:alcohol dehydrogenase class IV
MKTSVFQMQTKVIHGLGSLQQLPKELKALGGSRPWIVTDPGIAGSGILDEVRAVLEAAGMPTGVFTDVTHIAKVSAIDESWRLAEEHGTDCVIALGGGSALVVGKATGILGGASLEARRQARPAPSIREFAFNPPVHVMPVVAIPTTAGSGAEVSPHQPMVDEEYNRKITVSSPACYPRVALLDANLMRTLPFVQATRSGIDALTHAIEACLTDQSTAITNGLALHAMQMLMQNLRQSCMTDDLEAKQACLEASCVANMACGNAKLGYVHGLARNVQTMFSVPYGETIGVFLPYVMEFNLPSALDRFEMMAPYLGVNTAGKTPIEIGESAIYQVKRLLADLNFPRKFSEDVVDRSYIPVMAKMVFTRRKEENMTMEELHNLNVSGYGPNPNIRKAAYDDIVKLYELSLQGWEL